VFGDVKPLLRASEDAMTRLRVLLSKFTGLFRRARLERQLDEDVHAHLEMLTEENLRKGMEPEEAHYTALRQFGNVSSMKEECRERWSIRIIEELTQDVRYGLRQLRRNPGFTTLAIITLALGIGGVTAIFSVVYGAMLHPLPYADSHRLAVLVSRNAREGTDQGFAWISASEFLDYREQNRVFDEVLGVAGGHTLLTGTDVPDQIDRAFWVTDNFFRALGVPPLIGRSLTPEDSKPGAPPVVVLSYKLWQSRFGGVPGIVGHSLVLNSRPTTVVGVMPSRFTPLDAHLFLPAIPSRNKLANQPEYFSLIGHLKPGVSIAQAASNVAVLSKRFAAVYPKDHPPEVTFGIESYNDASVWEFRKTLFILLGAVGFLLLIACTNVANLLLARSSTRQHEVAIRAAVGASRGRLVRQFLVESLLLALGGAILGCLFARSVLKGLVTIIPPDRLPSEALVRISGTVLVFTLGLALLSTLLFGLAPAMLAVRRDVQAPLMAVNRGGSESLGHHRLRGLLVVSEVALSLVLLMGAGILIRGFVALHEIKLGYNTDHLLLSNILLPVERYKTVAERNQFHIEVLRRVRSLPGVVSAALGSSTPLGHGGPTPIEIFGKSKTGNWRPYLDFLSDRYFHTAGIPLLKGRDISEGDFTHARKVAVVNRAFVTRYLAGRNPLGRQFRVIESAGSQNPHQPVWFEIVGVVADTVSAGEIGPEIATEPRLYVPYTVAGAPWTSLLLRTVGQPESLLKSVRREVAAIDKEVPVGYSASMQYQLNLEWYTEPRFVMGMLAGFALLGMVLVCIGVYGVLSYAVSQRTQEFGIRMALGAQAADVRRMVLQWGLRWLAIGIGIGVPVSIALERILRNRIWGITSADPLTLIAVCLVLTAVGLAACYFPARRASKVDPIVALRYE
jgi:putative ABC transport system permease protein